MQQRALKPRSRPPSAPSAAGPPKAAWRIACPAASGWRDQGSQCRFRGRSSTFAGLQAVTALPSPPLDVGGRLPEGKRAYGRLAPECPVTAAAVVRSIGRRSVSRRHRLSTDEQRLMAEDLPLAVHHRDAMAGRRDVCITWSLSLRRVCVARPKSLPRWRAGRGYRRRLAVPRDRRRTASMPLTCRRRSAP